MAILLYLYYKYSKVLCSRETVKPLTISPEPKCTWSVCFHLLYGTAQKDFVIESLNTQLVSKRGHYNNTLWEKYKILVLQWNDLTKQPEIIEAVKRVEERKEQEVEAKREKQARQD